MLGRKPQARAYVEELGRLKPDFEGRARDLLARVLKVDSIAERVIDGLRKAGLELP
jgi:hypothetical protein